jgi:hypothetical protein
MTTIRTELLDELLKDYRTPADLLGEAGLFHDLKKALLERALAAELTEHRMWAMRSICVRAGAGTRATAQTKRRSWRRTAR